jgi:hypothetical protein
MKYGVGLILDVLLAFLQIERFSRMDEFAAKPRRQFCTRR